MREFRETPGLHSFQSPGPKSGRARAGNRPSGGLRATQGEHVVTRFRTQKTAALLASLAYHRGRSHAREILIELFWPDASEDSARHNLSLALSSLRSQMELPGVPDGSVIDYAPLLLRFF